MEVDLLSEEHILTFEPFNCSGCMYCMAVCSTFHEKATSFSKSRIQIARHEGHAISPIGAEDDLIFTPTLVNCDLCDGKPQCVKFCTYDALRFVPRTEAKIKRLKVLENKEAKKK